MNGGVTSSDMKSGDRFGIFTVVIRSRIGFLRPFFICCCCCCYLSCVVVVVYIFFAAAAAATASASALT
jgi:hypothetical protein